MERSGLCGVANSTAVAEMLVPAHCPMNRPIDRGRLLSQFQGKKAMMSNDEFKRDAVEQFTERGYPVREV